MSVDDPVAMPFDASAPLPGPGITVIEASAGTGKTYALTSLVVRFVAEGVPWSSLLAVTFTKMATGELRDRIRSRMVEAHDALARGHTGDDELMRCLASGSADDVDTRRVRLADALADFDSATIATTHGFCQLVLHGLGTAGDVVPGTTLLEDPDDLIEQVVDDLYLRWNLLHPTAEPVFRLEEARRAAFEAVRNPDALLVPPAGEDPSGLVRRLAAKAREEVSRRLLDQHLLTYDQVLYRLATTLEDPGRGPLACRRLGDRYRIVLVDEFQDTDPIQWTVLRQAFTGGSTRLVLIGDPKQAVYSFRGADVHAYLDARESADHFLTLDTNWRADQPLLTATDALLSPLQFGHEKIAFRSVKAPAGRQESGITGDGLPPIRWRVVHDSQKGIPATTRGLLRRPALREWVAADVAADVQRLLASGAKLVEGGVSRDLEMRDVAVLTRTNVQASIVRDELRRHGVPSVVAGLDSVFRSDAAGAWLRLLEALQEPSSRARSAAVALGPFVGLTRAQAASAGDTEWEDLHDRLHRWAGVLSNRGVAALYRTLLTEQALPARLLATEGGERELTDLAHLAQLLHREAVASQLGGPGLRNWLAARIRSVMEEQGEAEERSRRLDSDAEAVQVLTIHRAKGLEWPVVYCPYLWDVGRTDGGTPPVVFHDPEQGGTRTLDVGGPVHPGPAKRRYDEHAAISRAERRGEDLRVLYVALTRARHRLVIWWGRTQECRHSPLGRLLIGRDGFTGEIRESRGSEPSGKQVRTVLDAMMAGAPDLIAVEAATGGETGTDLIAVRSGVGPGLGPAGTLAAAPFTRSLDFGWRRASYSSITAAAHDHPVPPVGSEPEADGVRDEPAPADAGGLVADAPVEGALASPWVGIPGGADVGTLVHRLLERVDFTSPDLVREVAAAAGEIGRREGMAGVDPDVLVPGLVAALTTPLGPAVAGASLASISRADRLDELSFELPVAGGEASVGSVGMSSVADVLSPYITTGDRLDGYAERLRDPLLDASIRGYLTGSLDLVFRRPGPDGGVRWYVADYKTNWLGRSPSPGVAVDAGSGVVVGGGPGLSTWDYRLDALDAEMQRRHYPLQALIYSVALHRYLRWRQPGYRPEDHFGGVLYLFLRGMAGPETPIVDGLPCGVWSWAVPPALVVALSDLFDTALVEAPG